MIRSIHRIAVGLTVWLAAPAVLGSVCLTNEFPHPCATVEACRSVIERDPLDAAARLSLCEQLVARGDLVDAVVVVQRGLQLCTGRRGVCNTLEQALSNVEERRVAGERARGQDDVARHKDALRGYCLGRVTTERTINACEELIAGNPEPDLLVALGRKLLSTGQPARAVVAARDARSRGAASPALESLIRDAETQRAAAVTRCTEQSDLQACDAALLAGESDEHKVLRERGRILGSRGAPQQALRALAAAYALSPNDSVTGDLIAALRESDFPGGDLEFHRLRARVFETRGQRDDEIRELTAISRLDPQARDAQQRLRLLTERATAAAPPPTVVRTIPEYDEPANVSRVSGSGSPQPSAPPAPNHSNRLLADGRTH